MKVICFGDSHANFYKNIDICEGVYLGGQLAYTLQKRKQTVLDIYNERQDKEKYALYCFGEIDVRYHLPKYNNVEECVDRYISAIVDFGLPSIVAGVTATPWKDDFNPPILGTEKERNFMTLEFNILTKIKCNGLNIPFFSLDDILIKDDLTTEQKYYCTDGVHLNNDVLTTIIVRNRIVEAMLESKN